MSTSAHGTRKSFQFKVTCHNLNVFFAEVVIKKNIKVQYEFDVNASYCFPLQH